MIGRDLLRQLGHATKPLRQRIINSIARGVVQLVDDGTKMQLLQVAVLQLLAKGTEDVDEAERFQTYGFSSVPLPGAEAVVLFPNGDRSHPLVVAVDDRRYRPTGGEPGETVIYTDEGDTIRLARGHVISITTTGTVNVDAGTVNLGPDAATLTPLDGLVHGAGIHPILGVPYSQLGVTSTKVRGRK